MKVLLIIGSILAIILLIGVIVKLSLEIKEDRSVIFNYTLIVAIVLVIIKNVYSIIELHGL